MCAKPKEEKNSNCTSCAVLVECIVHCILVNGITAKFRAYTQQYTENSANILKMVRQGLKMLQSRPEKSNQCLKFVRQGIT